MQINRSILFLFVISLFVNAFTNSIKFPAGFHKGTGISVYQNGGHLIGESNWSNFENAFVYANAKQLCGPAIKNDEKVGRAAGFWDLAFDDIKLIKELGCNAFRFSIEWPEVEPIQGVFNDEVLDFYERYVDELIKNNITPMITLYHFVHPLWFEKMGGFESEENIALFVRYCQKVFERLGKKVKFWGTINEPTVVAACGYVLGIHPPGKCLRFTKSAQVLCNLLNAHVETYCALKKMPNGNQAQIGIIHQVLQAETFNPVFATNWLIGLMRKYTGFPLAQFLNKVFAHNVTKKFLKTGEFEYRIPGLTTVKLYNPDAPNSYDFIGMNFYSKVVFGPGPTCYPHQQMTDMDYPMSPETLYQAIVDLSDLGKPIYITENGVADAKDCLRENFIREYLSSVQKAIADGYDVRGYYYWTLMDNFEWNDGFSMKFGLYDVDFITQKRTLRKGAEIYRDMV
ncbi:MAG: family 1 glycosylhydrolase [Candidatus Babeliales bacterium]